MSIIAKADLAAALKMEASDYMTTVIGRAQSILEDGFWKRNMESASVTETRSGDGTSVMFLRQTPVTAITSITIDDAAVSDVTDTDYVRYNGNNGMLMLMQNTFTDDFQNVTIVYTAGYSADDMPDAIKQAVLELALILWHDTGEGHGRTGLKSENNPEGGTQSYLRRMNPDTLAAAKRFKRISL